MTVHPVLLTLWAALGIAFMALLVYRSQLTRYEDEQLFLNEENTSSRQLEQEQIVSRITRTAPIFNLVAGATAVITLCIVGMYVWNALQTIHFKLT
jgi:uncharacterized protein HemX